MWNIRGLLLYPLNKGFFFLSRKTFRQGGNGWSGVFELNLIFYSHGEGDAP